MAFQSTYDPLSPTPYQPQPTPEQPAAPQPSIPTPSPLGGQPGFQFEGHGNISHAGAVAGVFDNILRGYVNGKAMGEAKKALQLKKKSDDLNTSYKSDADRLWMVTQKQIAEKGAIDQNSDEFKQALSAVQGSWGALQDFRGNLLDDGKKKKPGKNGQERSPAEVLSDPKSTPQEKAQALHGMAQKAGPPILGQIQTYSAQAQARANRPEVQDADIRAKANLELSQLRTQKEPLTEQQQARVKQLEEYMTPTPKVGSTGGFNRYRTNEKGEEMEYQVDARGDEIPGTERRRSAAAPPKPVRAFKIAANGKPTSVLLDPKTNQEIPGSENPEIVPPSGMLQHISQGHYMYTDQNGEVHDVPITRSTAPVLPKPTDTSATGDSTRFMVTPNPKGLISPGNLPIDNRPTIQNTDGTHSSEYSVSFTDDKGHEVLVPTVVDGKFLTPDGKKPPQGSPEEKAMFDRAWKHYEQTGENLGTFDNAKDADAYAGDLHNRGNKPRGKGVEPDSRKQMRPVPKNVTAPQVSSVPHGTSGDHIIGHKGPISRAKIDQLDKDTQAQYQKAVDNFHKLTDDLNDPTLKLTSEQKDAAKKKYYDRLQEENRNIGKEHSDRMRDMGLSPADDSSAPKKDSLGIL